MIAGVLLLAALQAPSTPATDLDAALRRVREAATLADEDPERGRGALALALRELRELAPELAARPDALRERLLAQLVLARAFLATGSRDGALEAMDEALRLAGDDPLPLEELGPSVARLHQERMQAWSPARAGTIVVHCRSTCRVLLDEREVGREIRGLAPGRYRLWIDAPGAAPERSEVVVEASATPVLINHPRQPRARPLAGPASAETPASRRGMVVGGSVGLALGLAGIATGATLLALDGRCSGGDKDPATCPNLYELTIVGAVATSAGVALAITGAALLGTARRRTSGRRARVALHGSGLAF